LRGSLPHVDDVGGQGEAGEVGSAGHGVYPVLTV
jgi:hypothetical protein